MAGRGRKDAPNKPTWHDKTIIKHCNRKHSGTPMSPEEFRRKLEETKWVEIDPPIMPLDDGLSATLPGRIDEAIRRAGLTSKMLCDLIGDVSEKAVDSWRSGASRPTLAHIDAICQACKCTPSYLMGYSDTLTDKITCYAAGLSVEDRVSLWNTMIQAFRLKRPEGVVVGPTRRKYIYLLNRAANLLDTAFVEEHMKVPHQTDSTDGS